MKTSHRKQPGVILLFAGVTGVWLGAGLILHQGPFLTNLEDRGLFGDSFGAVNALFAGFAFAGVIYTILLQREELRLQREELRLTRHELSRSADAQQRSTLRQTQSARVVALTALLTWSIRQDDTGKGWVFGYNPNPENIAVEIRQILEELEKS